MSIILELIQPWGEKSHKLSSIVSHVISIKYHHFTVLIMLITPTIITITILVFARLGNGLKSLVQ